MATDFNALVTTAEGLTFDGAKPSTLRDAGFDLWVELNTGVADLSRAIVNGDALAGLDTSALMELGLASMGLAMWAAENVEMASLPDRAPDALVGPVVNPMMRGEIYTMLWDEPDAIVAMGAKKNAAGQLVPMGGAQQLPKDAELDGRLQGVIDLMLPQWLAKAFEQGGAPKPDAPGGPELAA